MELTIRIVIADKDAAQRRLMAAMVHDLHPSWRVVAEAGSVLSAKLALYNFEPHLLIIDPLLKGATDALWILGLPSRMPVIYATDNPGLALQAFEQQAIDFFLKPVSRSRLKLGLDRFLKLIVSTNMVTLDASVPILASIPVVSENQYLDWIPAKKNGLTRIILTSDIYFLKAHKKYTHIYTATEMLIMKIGSLELERQLDPRFFRRIHRGSVVNLRYLSSFHRGTGGRFRLILRDQPEIHVVSASHAHFFRSLDVGSTYFATSLAGGQ